MVLTRDVTEEIKSAVNSAMMKFLKDETFIKTISDSVAEAVTASMQKKLTLIEQKVTDLNNKMEGMTKEYEQKINNLECVTKTLVTERKTLEKKFDNIEQISKRQNLRIFNVKETKNENVRDDLIQFLNSKMSLNIKSSDMELCYRIGRRDEGNRMKPRGIFLTLKSYDMKQAIYSKKRLLKGTGVVIREDLTKLRLNIFSRTIENTSLKNVWTDEGNIYVNHNNKIIILKSEDDFHKLFGDV
ncbi:unnamed protein product [Phaedon cochleariae]|uniref:Uncharacterized protein n=1 Tax=Phaedon cochleariae TaxID=80249 RepID=A0A9P0DR04_PHACE|nr:unnamed protein product [Phaedon cochleariae]